MRVKNKETGVVGEADQVQGGLIAQGATSVNGDWLAEGKIYKPSEFVDKFEIVDSRTHEIGIRHAVKAEKGDYIVEGRVVRAKDFADRYEVLAPPVRIRNRATGVVSEAEKYDAVVLKKVTMTEAETKEDNANKTIFAKLGAHVSANAQVDADGHLYGTDYATGTTHDLNAQSGVRSGNNYANGQHDANRDVRSANGDLRSTQVNRNAQYNRRTESENAADVKAGPEHDQVVQMDRGQNKVDADYRSGSANGDAKKVE